MNSEIVFGLEGAAWPALLLDAGCSVLRSNSAALTAFGAALKGENPPLSAIWSPENPMAPQEFLVEWERTPMATGILKFRAANGETKKFVAAICVFGKNGQKWFVLQLLPTGEAIAIPGQQRASAPIPAAAPPPAPAPVPAMPEISGDAKAAASDVGGVLLKQKLDCALQLARTVSLDFNNALTSVLGHTSLLLSKAEAGHPWRHSLMEVEKSAARAAEIANELQTFSRQEKEVKRVEAGNINTIVNRCVEFFKNANADKIGWNLQLDQNLFASRFDEAKVQQALTKILENSVEAFGGGKGQITVQTRNVELSEPTQDRNVKLSAGTYVCVEISDSGSGIDTEILPRIFEPFFTTKGKAHRGLGLALVYGIITNHGGGVAVSSQPGAGTSVRIYLPAEKSFVREIKAGGEDLHGTGTILVVDDESILLTMAETILTEFGYKILTANNAQKALTILSHGDTKVDLIVTDLVMPGMGGRELIERVKQLWPSARILCTSGYVMPQDKQMNVPYLQKPYTAMDLLAKVKSLLTAVPSV